MDFGPALVFDLFITVIFYLGIPLIICGVSSKPLTIKRAKKTVIINSICWWLFFRILNPGSTGASVFLWSGIAYAILKKKCKEEPEETPEALTEDEKMKKVIEDMIKEKEDEYRQKGLEPPKTIEFDVAEAGRRLGTNFLVEKEPSTTQPSEFSLSEKDAPFKKYGDFATPSNDLMVQKPEPTVSHNEQFSLSWADETPAKGSMSETAYIPPKQEPTEAKPRNRVYGVLGNTPTGESVNSSANAKQPKKENNHSGNKGLMVIIIFAVLLVIAFAVVLGWKIVQYNNKYNQENLRVGVSPDFYPYEYIDNSGNFVGIEIEMLEAIAEELDLQVQFVNIDFHDLFTALVEGKVDCVIGGMEYTPQRQQLANVSNSLFTEKYDDFDFNSVIYIEKNNVDLQTAINNAISKFQKDGTFEAILSKYATIKEGETDYNNSTLEQNEPAAYKEVDGKSYTYYEDFNMYLRKDENAINVYYDEDEKSYYIVYNYTTGTRRLEEYDTDSEEWLKKNNSKSAF